MPFLESQGARLYYEVSGKAGPAIVLIHGGGCTHRDWHFVTELLASDHTVLAMDLRCHGASTGAIADCTVELWAADVNRLIVALGLAPAVLVGHSLASRIAAEAAWQQQGDCLGLMLLDGSRSVGGFAATEARPDAAMTPRGQASLAEIVDEIVGPHADSAVRNHVFETMSRHAMELLQQSVVAYQAWDAEHADRIFAALPQELPILAVQSTYHDRFTPRRSLTADTPGTPYLDFLRSIRPDIAIQIMPETGHFSMLEKPFEVARLIRDFCARAMSFGSVETI